VLGRKLRWGKPARNRKKYGKLKISDERFYSCWVPGPRRVPFLVEVIFLDCS
jgi:hypothetical protein